MEEGGEQGLPPNEELFQEQQVEPEPMEQDPVVAEPIVEPGVPEGSEAVNEEPEQAQFQEIAAEQHDDTIEATFRRHDDYAEPFFMPTAYVAPQDGEQEAYGDRENGNGDGAHRNEVDNTEHTIWIDSDEDHDPEEEILKANFYLPYSDHNYDPPDPTERVIHPQEGPFMVIDGLDEEGNIRNMWMPDGYGPPHRPRSVQEEEPAQQQQLHDQQLAQPQQPQYTTHPAVQQQQQQHLVAPMRQNMQQLSAAGRPVVAAQPFSIGGNQVEYADSMQRMPSRGIPITTGQTQYRVVSEYGGTTSSPMAPQGALRGTTMPRGTPTATIIRGNQPIYQSPAQRVAPAPVSASRNLPPAQPTPGSYQHISNPIGGQVRRLPPGMKPLGAAGIVAGPGILRQTPQTRPINVTRPLLEGGGTDTYDSPSTAPPPPPVRRIADVAPHRMTQEQRQEQQLMNRQRPQFPLRAGMTVGPGNRGTTLPTVIPGRGRIASSSEDLLRSPQRGQPILERKFQFKPVSMQPTPVEHTYSTPVPKASDQLPAQLTEDLPEDQPTSSSAVAAPESEIAEEVKPEVKSPTRLPGSTSPMKHQIGGMQKPTPPHRMSQEEKNAHFAKLHPDKDKPATPQQQLPTSSASGTPTHPSQSPANIHTLPPHHHAHPHHHQPTPVVAPLSRLPPHHQDDTLAVVQSVFESNAPRQPDTPKDKEAISKIADQLRFSADAFTGAAGSSGDGSRLRTTSGGRYQQQQMMYHDEGRKRQLSGGRYDGGNNMMMRSLPPTDNSPLMRHPEAMLEPPHRQRGRPRGSTGPQNPGRRWPEGQEPIAPHRAAGGARTLPPRNQEAPPPPTGRNGGAQNSDSESDGVGDGESWTMRCHCGMDHGDGDTVECEGCKAWQHMACMGLTPKSNTEMYKCELCAPRKLPITRAEARKVQRKLLDALARATEMEKKKKGRKSDPTEAKKQIQQPTSRKSAPMPQRQATPPPQRRIAQLNEYSKLAAQLLNSMPQTAGADTLLEDSRRHHKAEALFIEPDKNALVTTENVAIREVILEVNGRVSMAAEIKRMPGGGNGIFMYDGLMKGTTGEDMGKKQEFVCIETKNKFGNATNVTRRSCMPNCVLKHVLGTQATLGIMIVATKPIPRNQEVTLPFDADWIQSDIPLQCVDHSNRPDQICPFEQERVRAAQTRMAKEDRERRNAEEKRRAEEERRRLEEEVRRERAERTKQMDEEAERERLEQERIEKEKKAKEKEEAKKLEAEKKKKEDEKAGSSSSEAVAKAKQAESSASSTTAEKSSTKKDAIPGVKKEETPEDSDADSTSSDNIRRRTSRVHKKKNLEIKEHSSPATYGKRKQVTIPATAGKRPRTSSSQADDPGPSTSAATASPANRKRAPAATSSSSSTSATDAKKPKSNDEYALSELRDKMTSLLETTTTNRTMTEYKIDPSFIEGRRPDWIKKMEHDMEKIKAERAAATATSSGASSKKKKEEKRSEVVKEEKKETAKAPKLEKKETPKKVIEKEKKEVEKKNKDEQSAGPAPPAPAKDAVKAPESAAPKPKTPKAETKAPVAAVSKESAPAAPKEAPPKSAVQKEGSVSTEGSVEKDVGAPGAPAAAAAPAQVSTKKEPKRWSIDDYKKRPKKEIVAPATETGAGSSASTAPSTSGPAPARRGFIPSTEGLKDVKLSDIPLDDHPSNATNTNNTAPSTTTTTTVPGATVVNSPSTRSRTRGAASESADDAPAEHSMSLKDRITSMFGGINAPAAAPTAQKSSTSNATNATTTTPSSSSTTTSSSGRSRSRPTRWETN